MQINKTEKQECQTWNVDVDVTDVSETRCNEESVGNCYQHTSSRSQNKLIVWRSSAIVERCLTVKSDKLILSTRITRSLCIEIAAVAKILSHTEEKEAGGHSTLLIKDFNYLQSDWAAVRLKIWFQDLKKSFKLYMTTL